MASYTFKQAEKIVGELFGSILGRNADKAGYDHLIDVLTNGYKSIPEIVKDMLTSEEFREKYFINNTANELSKQLQIILWRKIKPNPVEVKKIAIELLENDWREVIVKMIDDPAYHEAYGKTKVPKVKY